MKKSMQMIWGALFLLSMMLMLTACQSSSDEVKQVRIAHFPNVTHGQALVARELDLFEKHFGEDIDVKYHVFNAGPSQIEAMFAGEVDLGYIGPVPAINGNIRSNGDIVILGGAVNSGAMLITSQDSKIHSIEDLAHKTIAIPQIGNTQHLSLLSMLSEAQLSDTTKGGTVEVIPVSNPDVKNLLERGEIHAAYVPEPWGSRLVEEIGARIVLDEKEVFRNGEYSSAVIIGRRDFVEANPELVDAFIKAHLEATLFLNENLEHAGIIMNEQIGQLTGHQLEADVMRSTVTRLAFSIDPITDSVIEFMNISEKEGFVRSVTSYERLFYLEPLNSILESQGKPLVQ